MKKINGKAFFRLGFGAMSLGGHFGAVDEESSIKSVHWLLENGVDFIDTARAYGDSESILGRALKDWKGERPFLATKVLAAEVKGALKPGAGWQYPVDVSEAYPQGSIRKSLEDSLRQLGVDFIDLLQLHQFWAQWENDLYWLDELEELKNEGKIRYIGISLPDHRHEMGLSILRNGRVDSVQTIFNIFDPLAADSLFPLCREKNIAVIARCLLDEGGLTGFLTQQTEFPKGAWIGKYFDCLPRKIYLDKIDRLRGLLSGEAESIAELAIRYVLSFSEIDVAVISMKSERNARANLKAASLPPLSDDLVETLRHEHRWIRNFYQARRYA